jgi:membrane protein implicated in regulation of membrane protease activity
MMLDVLLYSGNVWLIIGLLLAILELSNGSLIFFLPTGASGLLTGVVLKLQESDSITVFINGWSGALTFWAIISFIFALVLHKVVQRKETSEDINNY